MAIPTVSYPKATGNPILADDTNQIVEAIQRGEKDVYTRLLKLSSFASDPGTPEEGQVWYNTTEGIMKYYDGTAIAPIGGGGGGIEWTEVTATSETMASGSGYIANNAALVTLTLPATPDIGDVIEVAGSGAGGWRVAQNASQYIRWDEGAVDGFNKTTTGTGGYAESTDDYDAIELLCITGGASAVWKVNSSKGGINLN